MPEVLRQVLLAFGERREERGASCDWRRRLGKGFSCPAPRQIAVSAAAKIGTGPLTIASGADQSSSLARAITSHSCFCEFRQHHNIIVTQNRQSWKQSSKQSPEQPSLRPPWRDHKCPAAHRESRLGHQQLMLRFVRPVPVPAPAPVYASSRFLPLSCVSLPQRHRRASSRASADAVKMAKRKRPSVAAQDLQPPRGEPSSESISVLRASSHRVEDAGNTANNAKTPRRGRHATSQAVVSAGQGEHVLHPPGAPGGGGAVAAGPSADLRGQPGNDSSSLQGPDTTKRHVKVNSASGQTARPDPSSPTEVQLDDTTAVGAAIDPESPEGPNREDELENEDEVRDALFRPPPVNSDILPLPWKGRLGYVCPSFVAFASGTWLIIEFELGLPEYLSAKCQSSRLQFADLPNRQHHRASTSPQRPLPASACNQEPPRQGPACRR